MMVPADEVRSVLVKGQCLSIGTAYVLPYLIMLKSTKLADRFLVP